MFTGKVESYRKLRKKFDEYSDLKNSIFEIAFVKNKETDDWFIYYGRVILTNRPAAKNEQFVEKDEGVILVRIFGTRETALTFFLSLAEKSKYFISTDVKEINHLDIASGFVNICEPLIVPFQEGARHNIRNPAEKVTLYATKEVHNRGLNKFHDLNGMISEFFKIDLNLSVDLENTLSFYFEKEDGKIYDVTKSDAGLIWKVDFNEAEKTKYQIIILNYDSHPETREVFPLEKNMEYSKGKDIQKCELRLLKDGKIIDYYYLTLTSEQPKERHKELKQKQGNQLSSGIGKKLNEIESYIPFNNRKIRRLVAIIIIILIIVSLITTFYNNISDAWNKIFPPVASTGPLQSVLTVELAQTPLLKDGKTIIPMRLVNNSKANIEQLEVWYKFDCYMDDYYKLPLLYDTMAIGEEKEYFIPSSLDYNCNKNPRFEDRIFVDNKNNFYKIFGAPIKNVCCNCKLYIEIKGKKFDLNTISKEYAYYPTTLPNPSIIYSFVPKSGYNFEPIIEEQRVFPKVIYSSGDINDNYTELSPFGVSLPLFRQKCDTGEIGKQICEQYYDYWTPNCSKN